MAKKTSLDTKMVYKSARETALFHSGKETGMLPERLANPKWCKKYLRMLRNKGVLTNEEFQEIFKECGWAVRGKGYVPKGY